MDAPLPWERLLWSSQTLWRRSRYFLTDFRLARSGTPDSDEIFLQDIADVHQDQSRLERLLGLSTLTVDSRDAGRRPLVLRHVRRGAQLAALFELVAGDAQAS